jgi:hypothetical protein
MMTADSIQLSAYGLQLTARTQEEIPDRGDTIDDS